MGIFNFFKKNEPSKSKFPKELDPNNVDLSNSQYHGLLHQSRRMVEDDFITISQLKTQWINELDESGASILGEEKKNAIIECIYSDPQKLFEFAYEQYHDNSAPLHHCSIPLIKLAGLLGYEPALVLLCAHCLARLDPGELFFGLALLLRLVNEGNPEAKRMLAYLYYKGHDHLSLYIDYGKAAHLLYEIQNENCFTEDPVALTMYGILLDTCVLDLKEGCYNINYYDEDGNFVNSFTVKSDIPLNQDFVFNGDFLPPLLYKKALEMSKEVPFAEIGYKAWNGDTNACETFAEAIENGFYLKVIPEDKSFINAQVGIMIMGITGNWKIGNLVPKTCIADNWRERAEENTDI